MAKKAAPTVEMALRFWGSNVTAVQDVEEKMGFAREDAVRYLLTLGAEKWADEKKKAEEAAG